MRRLVVSMLVGLAIVAFVTPPAIGQTATTSTTPTTTPGLKLLDRTLPVVTNASTQGGMVLWPDGRRGYQHAATGSQASPNQVAAVDLDSLQEVARSAILAPPIVRASANNVIAVDENGARLVVAHTSALFGECPREQCLKGFHVLDAKTLQTIRTIPLTGAGDDVVTVTPWLQAMTVSPPRHADDVPKLHVVYDDASNDDGATRTPQAVSVLAQFDLATGAQDWAIRLASCTGSRSAAKGRIPMPVAVGSLPTPTASEPPVFYVGCYGSGGSSQIVKVILDEAVPARSLQSSVPGPSETTSFRFDREGRRIYARVGYTNDTWWVFDIQRNVFIGVVGVMPADPNRATAGLDYDTGRLYALAQPTAASGRTPATPGGLVIADLRRTPLPQVTPFPQYAEYSSVDGDNHVVIAVDPARAGRPRRVFLRPGYPTSTPTNSPKHYLIIEDTIPISTDPPPDDPDGLTVDMAEQDGVAEARYNGTARGYGLRTIFVGGYETVPRTALYDVSVLWRNGTYEVFDDCGARDREAVFGSAGPATLSDGSSDAQAQPIAVDASTREDVVDPLVRCRPDETMPPAGVEDPLEPTDEEDPDGETEEADEPLLSYGATECVAPDPDPLRSDPPRTTASLHVERTDDDQADEDAEIEGFTADVACSLEVVGDAHSEGVSVGDVSITDAYSNFHSYRDSTRGLVVRVESVARGIRIGDSVSIESVTTVAESWAKGRRQPSASTALNCDRTRTAGTCLERTIVGVKAGSFSCTQCKDHEADMVEAMQRALSREWTIRIREPDPQLAAGSPGGYIAAIQKPPGESFSDGVLNSDSLMTLPGLEMIRTVDGQMSRGRQIIQFAGVEAATTYGIQLLPQDVDFEGDPGRLDVRLEDGDGAPLAGGRFSLVPLGASGIDALLGAECTTGEDGTGDCVFEDLAPGDYTLEQTAAPPGYQESEDLAVTVEPFSDNTARFVNLRAVGAVELALQDDASQPLSGGRFELVEDDGDGVAGENDITVADCTTPEAGTCRFEDVPLGSYVMRQAEAPTDYLAADPIGFVLDTPGQVAQLTVVNGLVPIEGEEGREGEEVVEEPAEEPSWMEVIIEEGIEAPEPVLETEFIDAEPPSLLRRLLDLPRDVAAFLLRHPKEALLFAAVWALFAGAATLATRRRMLVLGTAPNAALART